MGHGSDEHGERAGLLRRVWRSIFRGPIVPRTDRERKWVVFHHLILHFRPTQLPARTLRYTHTFGLGGMSLVLFLLLASTGVLLMFAYEPTPDTAYDSVVRLQEEVAFGTLVRNVHHWSANLLIAVVVLHVLRVFFTCAFHPPRQFNWVIGLCLLLCVLASNFTGYLLPWDQLSYWAVTIVTGMSAYVPGIGEWLQSALRGGPEIGSSTLVSYYAFHTTVLPGGFVVLMAFHFWRVRKAGGVVVPRAPEEEPEKRPRMALGLPDLLLRELVVGLILMAVVLVLAVAFDAPLGERANPGMSPNPAKAPWYFLGLQELLFHFHPLFAVFVLPLLTAGALLAIPYLRYDGDSSGVFLASRKGRRTAAIATVTALVATPLWIVADELWVDLGGVLGGLPPVIREGLIPAAVLVGLLWAFHLLMRKGLSAARNEVVQALFVLVAVGFAILTITGVWFRGEGMALVWPWNA